MATLNYVTDTKALEMLMIDRGVRTNKELSEKCGIDRNIASKVRRGEIQPSSNVMYKLAIGLEMTSSEAGQIFFCPVLT
jgi:transcriptional regulator with XRE-family HTH domain